jgi:hypothetical protein
MGRLVDWRPAVSPAGSAAAIGGEETGNGQVKPKADVDITVAPP